MHDHQTTRFTAAVRKLLSLKGEAPEPSFGVHIEDERPEFSFVKGERLWAQFNSVTSGAAQLCVVGIRNPANSNVLVVVTRALFGLSAAASVRLETAYVISASAGASMFSLDTRWGQQATTTQFFAAALAGFGGHIVLEKAAAAKPAYADMMSDSASPPIILAPGTECALVGAAVGVQTMDAFFAGYERPLESGELFA